MKRFAATSLIIATAIVSLAGCGSSEDGANGGGATAGNSGLYSTEVNGGVLDIVIPAPAADPTVVGITQYAAAVGFTEPMSFLNQTLTNQGDGKAFMCDPSIVTSDGETIKFSRAFVFISELIALVPQGDYELNNQGVRLYNSVLGSDRALPGAKTTGTYITTSDVSVFDRMFSGAFTKETMGQGCDTEVTAQ